DLSIWDMSLSNSYLPVRNRGNNYKIDREEQRERTFTGIRGISEQDMSIQEAMGRISPRWKEHLGTTDRAIIEFRRMLLDMARALQEGKEPEAPHNPAAYQVRSAAFTIGRDIEWEVASEDLVKARV